jgi:hypothetical protein
MALPGELPISRWNVTLGGGGSRVAAIAGAMERLDQYGETMRMQCISVGGLVASPYVTGVSWEHMRTMGISQSMKEIVTMSRELSGSPDVSNSRTPTGLAKLVAHMRALPAMIHEGRIAQLGTTADWLEMQSALNGFATRFNRLAPLDPEYARHLKPREATRLVVRLQIANPSVRARTGPGRFGQAIEWAVDHAASEKEGKRVKSMHDFTTFRLPWDLHKLLPGIDLGMLSVARTAVLGMALPIAFSPRHLRDAVVATMWDDYDSWDTGDPRRLTTERWDRNGQTIFSHHEHFNEAHDKLSSDGGLVRTLSTRGVFCLEDGRLDPLPQIAIGVMPKNVKPEQQREKDALAHPGTIVIRVPATDENERYVSTGKFGVPASTRKHLWDEGGEAVDRAMEDPMNWRILQKSAKTTRCAMPNLSLVRQPRRIDTTSRERPSALSQRSQSIHL